MLGQLLPTKLLKALWPRVEGEGLRPLPTFGPLIGDEIKESELRDLGNKPSPRKLCGLGEPVEERES